MQDMTKPGRQLINNVLDELHFKLRLEKNILEMENAIKIKENVISNSRPGSKQSGNFGND